MESRFALVKLTALTVCCAFGVGMTQLAHAHSLDIGYRSGHQSGYESGYDSGYQGHSRYRGHSHYSVSIGLGSGYYANDYGNQGYYQPAYYDAPAPSYYDPNDSYDDEGDGAAYGGYYPNNGYYGDDSSYRDGRGNEDRDDRRRWDGDGGGRDDEGDRP